VVPKRCIPKKFSSNLAKNFPEATSLSSKVVKRLCRKWIGKTNTDAIYHLSHGKLFLNPLLSVMKILSISERELFVIDEFTGQELNKCCLEFGKRIKKCWLYTGKSSLYIPHPLFYPFGYCLLPSKRRT
jgi:hypothetical protein